MRDASARPWRIVVWIGVGAVLVAVVWTVVANRVPADPAVRVRQFFARPHPHRYANQAAMVIREASAADAQVAVAILRTLIHDPDPRVRHGALMLLADRFAITADDDDIRGKIRAMLAEWFDGTSLEDRLPHLPYSFLCWLYARAETAAADDPAVTGPFTVDLGTLTANELRWLLAVTLERAEPARSLVEDLLLGRPPADEAARRLRYLDAMDGTASVRTALERGELQAINVDDLLHALPAGLDVPQRLVDPHPAVRRAAGRLLAVCGDARGLPGLHEWLRAHLRFSGPVNTLMTALFGTDWRTSGASSGPARDAGPRGR